MYYINLSGNWDREKSGDTNKIRVQNVRLFIESKRAKIFYHFNIRQFIHAFRFPTLNYKRTKHHYILNADYKKNCEGFKDNSYFEVITYNCSTIIYNIVCII